MSLISLLVPGYDYLEIGSYLGASLHGHLSNDKCNSVTSVDLRPQGVIKDERHGVNDVFQYNSTTQDMLGVLEKHNIPTDKLTCIDGTVDNIPADKRFDLAFIDAEHTNDAVFYDATHCLPLMKESCIMLFHDAWVVYEGLEKFSNYLDSIDRPFAAAKMEGSDIYGLAMGSLIDPFTEYAKNYVEDWEKFKESSKYRLSQ
jgi:hypothetical protein